MRYQHILVVMSVIGLLAGATAQAQPPAVNTGTLKLHLDASQGVTLSGGAVSQWNDLSGSGNNFEQTSAALRPTQVAGAVGGQTGIRFTSDRLDAVATHNLNTGTGQPFTFFAVTGNTGGNGSLALFDSAPGQPNVYRYFNANNVEWWSADPQIAFNSQAAGTVISTQGFVNPNPSAGKRTLSNRTFDNTSGLIAKGAFSGTATGVTFLNPNIGTINGGGNGFFAGDVAEVLYYQGKLSVPDRFAVENYLRSKYGLAAPVGTFQYQQLPNPTISANSPAFSGAFAVDLALDGNPATEYASAGQGANTFIDFDFGEATLLTRIDFSDRKTGGTPPGSADNITAFNLIFSMDSIFGNADDRTVSVNSPLFANTDSIVINNGDGFLAQFLRFDVTATAGVNPGAAEFVFFTTSAPEPGSIALWGFLGVAAVMGIAWRRRANSRCKPQ